MSVGLGHEYTSNSNFFKVFYLGASLFTYISFPWASLVLQTVKSLPAVRETQVISQSRKDSLEKEMATHSSSLAWKIPWTEEPGRLQSMGL